MVRDGFHSVAVTGKAGGCRRGLRILCYNWIAFPCTLRRLVTAAIIICIRALPVKKLLGVDRGNSLTPVDNLASLSLWGIPEVELAYQTNDQPAPKFGRPRRLAISDKCVYHWTKCLLDIELVTHQRKKHLARCGLPDRGDIGDTW